MQWEDEGIVIYKKPIQEKGYRVDILTKENGRWSGWHKSKNIPQVGETVHCTWSSRLEDSLGFWKLEKIGSPIMFHPHQRLLAIHNMCQLCSKYLPERHAYPALYEASQHITSTEDNWMANYVHFELTFLQEMGFRLSLTQCAVTKETSNLTYVSPRTGCAVTQQVGNAYKDQLLHLPEFMLKPFPWEPITPAMYEQGLSLTGYFILKHICQGLTPNIPRFLIAA